MNWMSAVACVQHVKANTAFFNPKSISTGASRVVCPLLFTLYTNECVGIHLVNYTLKFTDGMLQFIVMRQWYIILLLWHRVVWTGVMWTSSFWMWRKLMEWWLTEHNLVIIHNTSHYTTLPLIRYTLISILVSILITCLPWKPAWLPTLQATAQVLVQVEVLDTGLHMYRYGNRSCRSCSGHYKGHREERTPVPKMSTLCSEEHREYCRLFNILKI